MSRIAGIDVARGLALLGMFVAHAAPRVTGNGTQPFLIELSDERSRLLFAVTAGLGLGLLTGGIRPPGPATAGRDSRRGLRVQIAIRAACLLALGLALDATGVLVSVILDEYGIAFAIMLPFVFLPAPALVAGGVLLLVCAPGAAAALAATVWRGDESTLADWFVTGAYPVFTWVAVLMLTAGLVRLDLTRWKVVTSVTVAGVVAMIVGLWVSTALGGRGIGSEPRLGPDPTGREIASATVGTSAFTIGNVGFCLALTMLLIALTSTVLGMSQRQARGVAAALSPVAAAGSMSLTVYSAHILVLVAVTRETPSGGLTDNGWDVVLGLVIGTLTLPWLWRRFIGRGPLETIVAKLSGRAHRGSRGIREATRRG